MQQNNDKRINPDSALQTMMVIWFALLMSQFILVGFAYFVKPELLDLSSAELLPAESALMIAVFVVLSISILAVSLFLRKTFLARSVAEQSVHLVQTAMIVGVALSESVVLFGLLLALVAGYKYFFLFGIVGVIGVLIHRPTKKAVLDATYKN
ncbi:MAG: hypothetical protein IPM50_08065 [Acidobacteriota bacterium]|nr:MAG: hypothetical protein IPM50_08065 [Acidobacteriota bacterium]